MRASPKYPNTTFNIMVDLTDVGLSNNDTEMVAQLQPLLVQNYPKVTILPKLCCDARIGSNSPKVTRAQTLELEPEAMHAKGHGRVPKRAGTFWDFLPFVARIRGRLLDGAVGGGAQVGKRRRQGEERRGSRLTPPK